MINVWEGKCLAKFKHYTIYTAIKPLRYFICTVFMLYIPGRNKPNFYKREIREIGL
jgi:hypothetical protein